MNNLICWHNNNFKSIADVSVSILDFGFIHSDATYDVMKTKNRNILFYQKHSNRYTDSCKYFGFTPILNIDTIAKDLLEKNNLDDAFVWVCNWRGTPPSGSPRDMSAVEHQVVYVKPYYNISNDKVSLTLDYNNRRVSDKSYPQRYKNFGWIELTKAQKYADAQNITSALVLDYNGFVTEGPGFGVCIVKNEQVYTPSENVLGSVTIEVVEDICKDLEIQFTRKPITPIELYNADAVFICSTSGGITEVAKVDHKEYNENNVVIKQLQAHYNAYD